MFCKYSANCLHLCGFTIKGVYVWRKNIEKTTLLSFFYLSPSDNPPAFHLSLKEREKTKVRNGGSHLAVLADKGGGSQLKRQKKSNAFLSVSFPWGCLFMITAYVQGNAGDRGRMLVSNLRVIWHSQSMPRVSLCKHNAAHNNLFSSGNWIAAEHLMRH